jgi:TatD DNase family protein
MLVDSHCHLDFPDFSDEIERVVGRAQIAGVGIMLTIGTRLDRFASVLALAERFANVYCTVGVHPNEADNAPEVLVEQLLDLSTHPKVVGFGETGLDFYYEKSDRERQKQSFRIHLEAARQAQLPVIVHTRDADCAMAEILTEEMAKGSFKALVHCFSSGQQLADIALDFGFYISVSGIITFKNADPLRQVVSTIPLNRLLVETDSPYLAPIPFRGKRNEPAHVVHTAKRLAELKSVEEGALAQATTANFMTLFSKIPTVPVPL